MNMYYSKNPIITSTSSMDTIKEELLRNDVKESTKLMMERLTLDEQMRVSFVPLIITQLAWTYADKAMKCAARDKVALLKKLCRSLKDVKQAYDNELKRELDYDHFKNIERQSDMCIAEMDKDLTILYFCVNQEFKRCAPEYPYEELRTYAIMSILFINFLRLYNLEIDKMLAVKLNDRNLIPSIVPPLIKDLRTIMYAFAGVDGKFNFKDKNVKLAISAIWNRINSIKFSIFD